MKKDISILKHPTQISEPVTIVICKRDSNPNPTYLRQDWVTFDQMRIVPHHIVNTDTIDLTTASCNNIHLPPSPPKLPNNTVTHELT